MPKREEICLCHMIKSFLQVVNALTSLTCFSISLNFGDFEYRFLLGSKEVDIYEKKAKVNVERE